MTYLYGRVVRGELARLCASVWRLSQSWYSMTRVGEWEGAMYKKTESAVPRQYTHPR